MRPFKTVNGRRVSLLMVSAALAAGGATARASVPSYSISNIGLTDSPLHVDPSGYAVNSPVAMNDAGQVCGYAFRFDGSTATGQDAWLYDPSSHSSIIIGLTDATHDGLDSPVAINNSGFVIGTANLNNAPTNDSYTPTDGWLYSPVTGTSQTIGITDAVHTDADGFHLNTPDAISDSGAVAGTAERFDGTTDLGSDAWFYTGGNAAVIGLADTAHTRSDGFRVNGNVMMSSTGTVIGTSERFDGDADLGQDAWTYDAINGTQKIGLTDAAHTAGDGSSYNQTVAVNSAGQVIGQATAYNAGSAVAEDAWIYSPSTHVSKIIGMNDAAHTNSDGYSTNVAIAINAAGRVAGYSSRTDGDNYNGDDAWVYNPVTDSAKVIGLFDSNHVEPGGFREEQPTAINALGMVAGYAQRNADENGENTGQDSWVYDPATDQTYMMDLPGGEFYSIINFLSDNGVALGDYQPTDEDSPRAFYWTESSGAVDLGSLVNGGLDASGWSELQHVMGMNASGEIYGFGATTSGDPQSIQAFLLTTAVPEPGCVSLLVIGAAAALRRRRRDF